MDCITISNISLSLKEMIDFSDLTASELDEFKNKYDLFIFDMDGCLIDSAHNPIKGVNESLCEIAKNGKHISVFTDNSISTMNDLAERIHRLFPIIPKENVMTSGHLVVRYLKEINFNKKIYAIGSESGIIAELKKYGFQVLHDEVAQISLADLRNVRFDSGVGAVLISADVNFSYMKLFKAVNYLVNPEVLLLQVHFPKVIQLNPIIPAAGSIIASVKAGSGRTDSICVGKGSEYCTKYLCSLGFDTSRCIFIGDGLASDIAAGNNCGMDTMLVLSGTNSLRDVEEAAALRIMNQIPTYYTNSVADLVKAFITEE